MTPTELGDQLRSLFGEFYLSRAAWDANPLVVSAGAVLEPERWVGVVLHHDVIAYAPSAFREDVIEHAHAVQRARPDLYVDATGRPEWPYSWGIAEHPNPELAWVIEGRGFARTGAHTENLNSTRYGIVLFGNYVARPMTPGMEKAFRALAGRILSPAIELGRELAPTLGHRQVVATACPGVSAFASVPRLQPPFSPAPLVPAQTERPDVELDDPITLRKINPANPEQFAGEPSSVRGALEFSHFHAAQAAVYGASAAGWAHQAAQNTEAIANELGRINTAPPASPTVEALSLALRAILTPELVAAALVELIKGLPLPGGGQ